MSRLLDDPKRVKALAAFFLVLRGLHVTMSTLTLSRLILRWKSIINWPWTQGWIPVSMIAGIITAPRHHSRFRI